MSKDYSITKAVIVGMGVGAAAGLISGVLADQYYQKHKTLRPDEILDRIKKAFNQNEDFEVIGSWIEYKKAPWSEFAIETQIYKGGISCQRESAIDQFEFIADASTGTVIKIDKVTY